MIRSLEVISALPPLIPSPAFPFSMFPPPRSSGFDIRSRIFLNDLAASSLSYASGTKDNDDVGFEQTGPFTFSPQAASTPKLGRGVGPRWLEPPGDGMCDGTCGYCPFEDREDFREENEARVGGEEDEVWRWRESNAGESESLASVSPLPSFEMSPDQMWRGPLRSDSVSTNARGGVWKFGVGDATAFGFDGEGETQDGGLGISMNRTRQQDVFDGDDSREVDSGEPAERLPVAWRRKRAKGWFFRGYA